MSTYTEGVNGAPAETTGGAGARALAQLALSDCSAIAAVRLTRRDPAKLARVLYGDDILDEGSPIALAVGKQFEAALLRDDFHRLRDALHRAGRISDPATVRIVNVDDAAHGTDPLALAEQARVSRDAILRTLRGDPSAPDVLWHPHFILTVMPGLRVSIIPDFVLLRHAESGLRVGEVKSYRDRGAYTGIASLRLARLQAAVEVLALQETVRALGVRPTASAPVVSETVDFTLRSRTGFYGVVRRRAAHVHREVERVRHALAAAALRLPAIMATVPGGTTIDSRIGFESLPYHYTEQCRGHCPLATRCAERAAAAGQPAILGDDLDAVIGGVVTMSELDAMLAGRAIPLTPAAASVADAFRHALTLAGVHPARHVHEVRRAS